VVAQGFGDAGYQRPGVPAVIAKTKHNQGIAKSGEPEPDPPLGHRLQTLLLQRPVRHRQHVV
jgi:hypothetical protein